MGQPAGMGGGGADSCDMQGRAGGAPPTGLKLSLGHSNTGVTQGLIPEMPSPFPILGAEGDGVRGKEEK